MKRVVLAFVLVAAISAACGDTKEVVIARAGPTAPNDGGVGPDGSSVEIEDEAGVDAASEEPPPPPKVTATSETIDIEGTSRQFVLVVPRELDPTRKLPLVLLFHGDGGNGEGLRQYLRFDDQSAENAIVVYPTGTWDLYTPSAQNADTKFVVALVSSLSARLPIDAEKLFALGHSRGAFFVNQLACRRDIALRGMAVHAGGAPYEQAGVGVGTYPNGYVKCSEAESAVATIVFHGDNDTNVTVDSGRFAAAYWAYVNGCQQTTKATTPAPCQSFDDCPATKPVDLCVVPGIGHSVWTEGVRTSWEFFLAQ